jgi:oxygen-independent coproporphyrinogen-3 oxidase
MLIESLVKELEHKTDYPGGEIIETIYIGGGTPSVLSIDEINLLLFKIFSLYKVKSLPETTFEVNPDDLNKTYLAQLHKGTAINRLSIGIQSFINRDLKLLNRRHDAKKAFDSVVNALETGFSNLSIDLIYAIPGMSLNEWIFNLNTVFSLNIHHLSAYHLSFEPGTLMHQKLQRKEIVQVKEDQSLEQYQKLIEMAEMTGFEQYEISNFSRQGYVSQHNSNYWKGKKYIGIGPSAHSYNLKSRQWNISDNIEYIKRISENKIYYEMEHLNQDTRFNEMILTGLRTKWGVNLEEIIRQFGIEYYESLYKNAEQFIRNGNLYERNNHFLLTRKGMLIADYIISALFSDEQKDTIKLK